MVTMMQNNKEVLFYLIQKLIELITYSIYSNEHFMDLNIFWLLHSKRNIQTNIPKLSNVKIEKKISLTVALIQEEAISISRL